MIALTVRGNDIDQKLRNTVAIQIHGAEIVSLVRGSLGRVCNIRILQECVVCLDALFLGSGSTAHFNLAGILLAVVSGSNPGSALFLCLNVSGRGDCGNALFGRLPLGGHLLSVLIKIEMDLFPSTVFVEGHFGLADLNGCCKCAGIWHQCDQY